MGTRKSVYTRDVLDEAVRCLALSSGPILDRVLGAGEILTSGLCRSDLPDREDRELFERIELTLAALRDDDVDNVSDVTVDATAVDILDLRDTLMGRAILEASRRRLAPNPSVAQDGSCGS
jgi:hypothetical protein